MDICALSYFVGFIFKTARSRPRSFLTRSIRFRFTTQFPGNFQNQYFGNPYCQFSTDVQTQASGNMQANFPSYTHPQFPGYLPNHFPGNSQSHQFATLQSQLGNLQNEQGNQFNRNLPDQSMNSQFSALNKVCFKF